MVVATAFAPGRANLIGEHTDYNGGLALPFAIEQGIEVRAERLERGAREVRAVAHDLGESDTFALADPRRDAGGWRAFVRGTVAELCAAGHELPPARIAIAGAGLPRGGGLSSSAALGLALAYALIALAGDEPGEPLPLARLCSRVENDWVGARTGLLDQLAVLLGRAGEAVRIDFRELDWQRVPLDLGDWRLALIDSGAARDLATGGYNERRAESRAAAQRLGVETLSDATVAAAAGLPPPLDRRLRHVLAENERVDQAVDALRRGDLARLAALLDASHASLRDDYDASAPAVEAAVERARRAGAAGARMMGGGFGGVVLALFPPDAKPPADALAVVPSAGVRLI